MHTCSGALKPPCSKHRGVSCLKGAWTREKTTGILKAAN